MNSILSRINSCSTTLFASKMFASGRWYPQPIDELSIHRSRPPNPGIHRRTRLLVVDNSSLGREATTSGKLAYCIWVYKKGYRDKHMPHATLGDKVLVAIRGEMKKAIVLGANTHVYYRKHGIPSTDANTIALLVGEFSHFRGLYNLDSDENPIGNRIIAPVPASLLKKRDNVAMAKVLALATKFF